MISLEVLGIHLVACVACSKGFWERGSASDALRELSWSGGFWGERRVPDELHDCGFCGIEFCGRVKVGSPKEVAIGFCLRGRDDLLVLA